MEKDKKLATSAPSQFSPTCTTGEACTHDHAPTESAGGPGQFILRIVRRIVEHYRKTDGQDNAELVANFFSKQAAPATALLSEEQVLSFTTRLNEAADTLDGGKSIRTCSSVHAQVRADVYRQIAAELNAMLRQPVGKEGK